ncbi:MAG: NTP transferase domain-containing protein, partial [Synergistes sp.]|nr:NTP transferase domain-containing protein [Synergistes sp.]
MKTLAVIPARYSSTRLPGKPLALIAGIPLVVRVLDNVRACSSVDRVIVAVDDERIAEAVRRAGGEAFMTPSELPSGGDRVAYVAKRVESEFVLNVQVDDPLVGADMIDPLVEALAADSSVKLALLVKRIEKEEEICSENIVKAVF